MRLSLCAIRNYLKNVRLRCNEIECVLFFYQLVGKRYMSALDHADICACVVAQADFGPEWRQLILISPLFAAAIRATAEYKFLYALAPYNPRGKLTLKEAAAANMHKIERYLVAASTRYEVYKVGLSLAREDLVLYYLDSDDFRPSGLKIDLNTILRDFIWYSHKHPQIVRWRPQRIADYIYRYDAYLYWFIGRPLITAECMHAHAPATVTVHAHANCRYCSYRARLVHTCRTINEAEYTTHISAVRFMRDSALLAECARYQETLRVRKRDVPKRPMPCWLRIDFGKTTRVETEQELAENKHSVYLVVFAMPWLRALVNAHNRERERECDTCATANLTVTN